MELTRLHRTPVAVGVGVLVVGVTLADMPELRLTGREEHKTMCDCKVLLAFERCLATAPASDVMMQPSRALSCPLVQHSL